VAAAVNMASEQGYDRVYGIGGARIYQEMIPLAHRLLISEVDLNVPDADTFFPDIDLETWRVVNKRTLREVGPNCYVNEYLRIS
jgi:dihydrofolate reductase